MPKDRYKKICLSLHQPAYNLQILNMAIIIALKIKGLFVYALRCFFYRIKIPIDFIISVLIYLATFLVEIFSLNINNL